ncbi:hypothetical protein TanjilG_15599 [Lupinus angustifolius]|nr:hypothetical protein TanjilG_15599 [Lupinus angustifolius]
MYLSESTIDLHCRKASRENSSRNEIMGRVNHLHKGLLEEDCQIFASIRNNQKIELTKGPFCLYDRFTGHSKRL